jgi:excisionase family DNA binding protein
MRFQFNPITPTQAEARAAHDAWLRLNRIPDSAGLQLVRDGQTEVVPLPAAAVRLLVQALGVLREGTEVAVVPTLQELSTPQAAKLMKVSRQFLAKMIDRGQIRGRKVGKHRRVYLRDALFWAHLCRM